jgi:hypothetical protein
MNCIGAYPKVNEKNRLLYGKTGNAYQMGDCPRSLRRGLSPIKEPLDQSENSLNGL